MERLRQRQATRLVVDLKNIVVCAAVRNVASTLEQDIIRIEKALDGFNVKWLFIESDSEDNTVPILKNLMLGNPNIRTEFLGSLQSRFPWRTSRLAFARNLYTQIVRDEYKDIDYVAVADMDGLNSDLTKEAVQSSFKRKDWDVVTSNQGDIYYDIWCVRAKGWVEYDCWQKYGNMVNSGDDDIVAFKYAIAPLLRHIPRDSDWIEVDSAHGGFLIFKPEAFVSGTHYPEANGKETCEIVAYNKGIRDAGFRIFINPAMINAESTDHSKFLLEKQGKIQ